TTGDGKEFAGLAPRKSSKNDDITTVVSDTMLEQFPASAASTASAKAPKGGRWKWRWATLSNGTPVHTNGRGSGFFVGGDGGNGGKGKKVKELGNLTFGSSGQDKESTDSPGLPPTGRGSDLSLSNPEVHNSPSALDPNRLSSSDAGGRVASIHSMTF